MKSPFFFWLPNPRHCNYFHFSASGSSSIWSIEPLLTLPRIYTISLVSFWLKSKKIMDLAGEYKGKAQKSKMKHWHGGRLGFNSDTSLVIKLPDAQVLRIMSRSLFLAVVLLTLPCLGSIFRGALSSSHTIDSGSETAYNLINVELLNLLFHDLAEEGLLTKNDKVLIMSPTYGFGSVIPLNNNEIDMVLDSDLERQSSFSDETYDFVFVPSSEDAEFVDRILKVDGIVALPLGSDSSNAFREKSNYRVLYIRRYSSIIVAMRKTGLANKIVDSSTKRKLYRLASEAKKMALRNLEGVLLEPPRQALVDSRKYLKKIKYLPDLLGDSLEAYKRRVFISVGLPDENKGVIRWFQQNYPKKNKKFEIHGILVVPEEASKQVVPDTDVSTWLSKHVKEEEYVVMKAEAEVVEDMIKKRTISLVDELFLECKNEWWQNGKRKKSSRAYWECLALYGRLRDEGVAVHQWWG